MSKFEEVVKTGVVDSPDQADALGAFEDDAVSETDALDAADDPVFDADDALDGALTVIEE